MKRALLILVVFVASFSGNVLAADCYTDKGCYEARAVQSAILKIQKCFAVGNCERKPVDYEYGPESLYSVLVLIDSREAKRVLSEFAEYDFGEMPSDALTTAIENAGDEIIPYLTERKEKRVACIEPKGARYKICRTQEDRNQIIDAWIRKFESHK